jgi:hypothetical protein
VLGSVDAVAPASEREQRRRALAVRAELLRLREHSDDPAAVSRAMLAAADAELEALATLHRDATPTLDWRELAATPPPIMPTVDQRRSNEARRRLQAYQPAALALTDKRAVLEAELERLLGVEESERAGMMDEWRATMASWSALCSLTGRVLCGDLDAYREVLAESGCLDEVHELIDPGSLRIELTSNAADVELVVDVSRIDALTFGSADDDLSLGGARAKAVRAFIAAAPLRVARELFGVLPLATVRVEIAVLDGASPRHDGHAREVSLTRDAVDAIDWQHATAEAAIEQLTRLGGEVARLVPD